MHAVTDNEILSVYNFLSWIIQSNMLYQYYTVYCKHQNNNTQAKSFVVHVS